MSRILWKSFHLCFPSNLIKCSSPPCLPPPSSGADQDNPNPPSLLLNPLYRCRRYHREDDSSGSRLSKRLATAHSTSSSATTAVTTATTTTTTSITSDDSDNYDITPDDDSPPPDFASAFASPRFFFSSPGRSNSITDSLGTRCRELSDFTPTSNVATKSATISRFLSGGAAVKQYVYSPDPYRDFRRSMEEMIEAMDVKDQAVLTDELYELLHELLFSYLSLNPRDSHEVIVRAFADILVSIVSEDRWKF